MSKKIILDLSWTDSTTQVPQDISLDEYLGRVGNPAYTGKPYEDITVEDLQDLDNALENTRGKKPS